jgi:hypothetical protein
MLKKWISIMVSLVLILGIASLSLGAEFHASPIPADYRSGPIPPAKSGDKAYCVIQNDDGSIAFYYGFFQAGDGVAAYMDPMTCGVPNPYPFKVSDAHFYLYGFPGSVWPVQIRVNVRDMAGSDSCDGPGNLLCSETFTIPADSAYPHLMNLSLNLLCCVNRPFFLEIIYTGGTSSPYPSPLFADVTSSTDTCNNWLKSGGTYFEWYLAWLPPVAGDIVLRATGNTQDTTCQVPESLYWKPGYEDYSPSGVPDLSQMQAVWVKDPTGAHTFCGPCAVANCFKWLDSKYNQVAPGVPGDGFDMFPLVRDYLDALPPLVGPFQDDHDPNNMDHPATPWFFGGTIAPPGTPQPFIPGNQHPPQPMTPWGELVERLAWYFNTDGVQTGYCQHNGTEVHEMYQGIQNWFDSEHFADGSTLAETLCVKLWQKPTFALVESLVEKCEDVILLLGFWYFEPEIPQFIRGDVDADGDLTMADLIRLQQGPPFMCDDAADINDDGIQDIGDLMYFVQFIYHGGPPPPSPFPGCGTDPTLDGLGCANPPPCPGGAWRRCGGHYVTVAGINSQDYLIAVSDPMFDWAEGGNPGRVLNGHYIPHTPGHAQTAHNDEGNVSHDMYHVIDDPISPGGLWELADYVVSQRPWYCDDLSLQNIPDEFQSVSVPRPGGDIPVITEVEYAVQISPWDYRGDVNASGVVELGDVVYLITYLYKSGPPPTSLTEADVNCSGLVELGDVVYLISYLYKNGAVPKCCDP